MIQLLNVLAWVGMALSLVGAFLVARRVPIGFGILLLADASLAPIQVYTRTWPQVTLLVTYAAVNLYALVKAHQVLMEET